MNALRNHWTGKWAVVFCAFSMLLALDAKALVTATATVTVQVGEGGTVTPNLNGQNLTIGKQYTLTAKPKSGFVFSGWAGDLSSASTKLTFVLSNDLSLTASFLDKQVPTVSIDPVLKSWSTNSISNAVYVVTGKVKDNGTVAQVYYRLNGGGWLPAMTGNGWSNWWASTSLIPNANIVEAYAVDNAGNVSKVVKWKIVYSAAQPNLYYPDQITMVVTDGGEGGNVLEEATFSTNVFTDVTGAGFYTYKKLGPDTGKLTMKYFAPPSAVNVTNNVNVTMLYDVYYSGTFKEAAGTFFLYKTYQLAPPTIDESTVTFNDSGGSEQTVIKFFKNPLVGDNGGVYNSANPQIIPLQSPYTGDISNRVLVPFSQVGNQNGGSSQVATPSFAGTVIDIYSNAVKVLFDAPLKSGKYTPLTGSPLRILTYHFDDYVDGSPVTNGLGTFTYTNYTWVGSLLQMKQPGTSKCIILTFTNDTSAGIYYNEQHNDDSTFLFSQGTFDLALPPQIINQPQDAASPIGATAIFQVTAAGTPVLAYQWLFNGASLTDGLSGSGSTISGSTTNILTISNVKSGDLGDYQVVITNNFGSVTSSVAQLLLAIPPQITSQPVSVTVSTNQAANFSVTATGTATLSYQWQFNGSNLKDGQTPQGSVVQNSKTANLSLSQVTMSDAGNYRVIVTNSAGTVISSPATLTVTSP
jgi:hypothetical protein